MAIDDEVFSQVHQLAQQQGRSIGAIVTSLLRQALAPATVTIRDGLPQFVVPPNAGALTSDAVTRALEDD